MQDRNSQYRKRRDLSRQRQNSWKRDRHKLS